MANPWRGDVTVTIDGEHFVARLTLGALAELEEDLGEDCLLALVERFESNRFSTRDVLALLHAGLRGGGHHIDPARLTSGDFDGGPMAAAKAAAQLLARAFVVPE